MDQSLRRVENTFAADKRQLGAKAVQDVEDCELEIDLDLGRLDRAASERLKDLFLTAASQARCHNDDACEHFLAALASLMETLQRSQWPQDADR